uniref:Uncharacterized protein n=1 Tax=Panagrellus redivivus TaxID=6233 RepID=A0A7E4UZL8_PANRE
MERILVERGRTRPVARTAEVVGREQADNATSQRFTAIAVTRAVAHITIPALAMSVETPPIRSLCVPRLSALSLFFLHVSQCTLAVASMGRVSSAAFYRNRRDSRRRAQHYPPRALLSSPVLSLHVLPISENITKSSSFPPVSALPTAERDLW